jgi:WD40 repeat protein
MPITKLKIATAVLLVLALIGAGGAGVSILTPKAVATNHVGTKTDEPEKPTLPSRSLKGPYKFSSLSWSRDGKSLATVTLDVDDEPGDSRAKNAVRLWDIPSGSVKRTLAEDPIKDRYYCTYAGVALSPDGKTVAAPAGGKFDGEDEFFLGFVLWDAETGKIRHKLKHGMEVRALGFSPDGKTVASGSGCGGAEGDFESVKLWDVKTGQLLRTLKTRDLEAVRVAFSPDSKLLAAAHDPVLDHSGGSAEVTLWDAALGKWSRALPDSAGIDVIAFSPDGKTLLGAARTKLLAWDVATGKTVQRSDLKTGFSDKVRSVLALSPDGKTLAISAKQEDKHVIAVYDVKTAKRTKTLEGHAGFLWSLCFAPDGNTLAGGSSDQTIYLWDFDRGTKPEK